MTALYNRWQKDKGAVEEPKWFPLLNSRASLLGSIMPDLPLIVISAVFIVWDMLEGNFRNADNIEAVSHTAYLFDELFFNDWRLKVAHNFFHAPLMAILFTAVGYFGWKRDKAWGAWLFWFGAACMLHSMIDITVHHDDGPLLLFPFDLNLRFESPVSYWDQKYYGREFAIFEHSLFLVMLGYLAWRWRVRREVRKSAEVRI